MSLRLTPPRPAAPPAEAQPPAVPPDGLPEHVWRPRPWIAAVLNVLAWGLGALYVGRPRRALATFVGVQLAMAAGIALAFVLPWPGARIALLVTTLPLAFVFAVADGWRTATQAPPAERRPFQRWYALLGVWLLLAVVVQPLILDAVRSQVQAFRIPSGSMAPALVEGDYLLSVMRVPDPLWRGTVVVHHDIDGMSFVRRVVGLPGDTLEMRRYHLHVNGVPVAEPYASVTDSVDYVSAEDFGWQVNYASSPSAERGTPSSATWGPLVVPPGQLFLLGDVRDMSLDSRYLGFVPHERLTGRPSWIYWSRDVESGAIRWERLGQDVR